jgi:hypothetical protein
MDTITIKNRMLILQAEINKLAAELPEHLQVNYRQREFRRGSDTGARKQLVVEFQELAPRSKVEYAVDLLYS